jgi:protein O-mannosyl-transferase
LLKEFKNKYRESLFSIRPDIIICLFIVITTLTVYWQVRNHSFINYDDGMYVTGNQYVQEGLNLKSISWAFSNTFAANWHPITWLSHMLDVQIHGMNAGSHHLTSLFFHIANTLLLFLVFRKMTGKIWQSSLVAALFAIHPLHVESVAWISERKDVLSTLFWLLAMWSYARYAEKPGLIRYLTVFIFFILGLMTKPMLVTLPFVFLLLDYWPLQRFKLNHKDDAIKKSEKRLPILLLVWEKVPFFIFSLLTSVVALVAQHNKGAVASIGRFTLFSRIENAIVSYVSYIGKMIWPGNLAAFYPHPGNLSVWKVAGSCLLLTLITYIAIRSIRLRPWFIMGWLWYIGTLVPVIGIVQVGLQAMADRYTYIPLIGLFIIIAWGVPELAIRWRLKKPVFVATTSVILLAFMMISWVQVRYWADNISLYEHALDVTSDNFLAHNGLGCDLTTRGMFDEAAIHYSKALRIRPEYAEAHYNLGHILSIKGKKEEAIEHFRKAIKIKPEYAEAHDYLGYELACQGNREEAIKHFRKAIKIKPEYAEAHNYLGYELLHQGKSKKALEHFRKALQIKPNYAAAHHNLGIALAEHNKYSEAIKHYRESLRINPGYAESYNGIGKIMAQQGNLKKAIKYFQKALQLKRGYRDAQNNLKNTLAAIKK